MKYKTLGVLAAALFLSGTGQTVVKGLIPPAFALNLKNKELMQLNYELKSSLKEAEEKLNTTIIEKEIENRKQDRKSVV